ncbi:MAG: RluA family pseudouridine synthase [Lachnospiraceae bacterium]|nr:RluA family pseudouridine synthase [Lachnospiraceae bacterium]
MNEETSEILIEIEEEQAGERLDLFLTDFFPERSRTWIRKRIEDGDVRLVSAQNKNCKPSTIVRDGDRVIFTVRPDAPIEAKPENIPLDILYEDNDLLVVNKPKGMVVHPAPGHPDHTLVNAVLYHTGSTLSGIGGMLRPGIVHRIDKDTTGSVIICKNDVAHQGIAGQLEKHTIDRVYHALLIGRLPEEEMRIEKPIARSRTDRKKMAVAAPGQEGKYAATTLHLIRYFPVDQISYVTCTLETGRTHQIRVHTASIGHPVLGDPVYGSDAGRKFKTQGQCLHAKTLCFEHPVTKERIETDAPLPEYFEHLLQILH